MADDLNPQAKQCNQKTVLVSVYTEGPRWRNMVPSGNHERGGHIHHFVQKSNKKEVTTMFKIGHSGVDHSCKGYNRRAELLLYSQRLRSSPADQDEDRSYLLKPKPNSSPKQSATNTVAGRKKTKGSMPPGCVEKCGISMSSFCRSVKNVEVGNTTKGKKHSTGSNNNAMKSAMKSLQMRKEKGFVAKMLEKVQKYR